jgi:exonuclease SbcC
MRPISLHLENVRTFDALDFDFPDGCCAIVGPNGSGKSTMVSALDIALFGAEGRSLADWLSKEKPDATMKIELVFEHDGSTYRIRRTYDGRGRGKSTLDFERLIA